MSVEFRAIREEEREACLDLWCTVWPGGGRDYFRRYFYGDMEWLPYYTQVAVLDGKLVSAVQICKRVVACGDFHLTMGGIANVATLPEHRGKGYNTECLKRAVAVMEADVMDFSLLFTGINAYYARLGYDTVPRRGVSGTIRTDFQPRPTIYAARPALDDDLLAIRRIYDGYNRRRPITVQREEAYWRDWIGMAPGRVPEMLFVATDARKEVCGYARCGTFRSAKPYSADEVNVRVMEFGVRDVGTTQEEEQTAALLNAIAAEFQAKGTRLLRLDIAREPAVLRALDAILETQEWAVTNSGMMRLLHRDNLLKSFTLELNDRWIAAGRPTGALTFETPYGPTRLNAGGQFLRAEPTEDATDALPQATLFRLLFGSLAPAEATQNAELHPLVTALFPPRAPIYYGADGF